MPPCDWKGKGCVTNHLLKQCPKFIGLTEKERIAHLKSINRCFNCFRKNHFTRDCESKARCGTCSGLHNTMLHKGFESKPQTALLGQSSATCSLFTSPVMISKLPNGQKFLTNAIHDPGATCSLMSDNLAKKMNLTGIIAPIDIQTLGSTNTIKTATKVLVNIFDHQGYAKGQLEAVVIPNFVSFFATDWNQYKAEHEHLKNIAIPKPFGDGKCEILIGNNCARLSITIDTSCIDENNKPVAAKSTLGWSIGGPTQATPKLKTE